MRASNSQRPWYPRSTTLVLSSLFLLFLVFPESRARSAFLSETGDKTLVSAEEKDALPEGVTIAGGEEFQKQKVDGILSERIKTEASDVLPKKIILEENKKKLDLEVKADPGLKIEKAGTSGIRRFDSDVATAAPDSEASHKAKVNPKGIHIGSETHVEVSEVKVNHLPDREDGDEKEREKFKRGRSDLESEIPIIRKSDTKEEVHQGEEDAPLISASDVQQAPVDTENKKPIIINSDGLGKFENPQKERETRTENHNIPRSGSEPSISAPKSEIIYTIIELLKQNAMLLQEQIRDKTLFETVKEPTLVIPEVPLLTEEDILESLKSVATTKKHQELNIEPFSHDLLSDKQLEIIQCSASIIAEQQRQTFISSMYDCVRNLSVVNCMRIFVYPILAETVPQLIIQNIPGLPVEVTVSDLLPNRNKTKSARSGTFLLYPLLNSEEVVMGMLKDALDTQRSYESVPSYIDPTNETFVKMLSPGQLRILQTAEKLLPVPARREYSDRMYSCVKRFEYYSCLRYFAWPMMKKYYPSLADFPEYLIVYPSYSQYPIVPFPLEPGQLPEVIEADIKARPRPDTLILRILREGIKPARGQPGYLVPLNLSIANASEIANKSDALPLVNLEQMIKTLPFPEKTPNAPVIPPLTIPQDQLNALLIARQVLPPALRAEFAAQSLKCVREVNYYACMKYYTWPILRQAQPTLPQFPDLSGLFQLPDFSQFFQIPDFSGLFQLPDFSGFGQPSFPMLPSFPGIPTIPMIPTIPTVPGSPTIPSIPTIPGSPTIPSIPTVPGSPTIPSIPTIPGAPPIPQIPGVPPASVEPANTEAPPTVQRSQSGSGTGESRHSPMDEPNASNPEEPRKPSEEATFTPQDIPQSPKIQISSRRNEIMSNVPVISITGNEFVPILSEKPESVIFTILRLYQISDPSLVNTLAISFLNSSTPEYANFLNLHEENTILLATSMLPQSARSSFSEQMISCACDKNFVTCSRELMFPTLLEYFPNLPSFPNFLPPVDTKNYTQLNSEQNVLRNPQISETNVKTDKHGEATLTITDTRFIPIFSEHPEGVVMNILRAVQLSTPNLPPGSLKTRDFIRTSEFENFLSEKQIMILEIGESLLPEEQREAFLEKMIECSRNNQFLECSKDIAFPTIAQYYPSLPNFPNFGNQPSLSEKQNSGFPGPTQLLRDGFPTSEIDSNSAYFQQIENHLQNEIENILIRTTSVNERSKSQDDPVPETLQIVPGFLSKQQRNIMRLSENILPESVRPVYHTKMTECMHSSSFVACMQDVGWPLLRLNPLLLHSIPQSVSDSIPQAPAIPIAAPIFPEGYRSPAPVYPDLSLNFPNGISILQQSAPSPQEGSSQDITSSVGRQISAPEIPAYAGQPFAPFVDLSKERVDPETEQESIKLETEMKIHHSRKKRSSMDLLDSYPEHDPDENKRSVRRNLSKTTFPNMTESELLQFLIHLKNSKDDHFRNSPHPSKKYFIDNLDPKVKNTLTADQLEILKLVEDLNPESSRGIMAQLWQCIRSLSLIRCAGVFIWPMITSNLPSLSPFSGRSEVSSEVQQFFGMAPNDFEKELLAKKQEFEDILLSWYKNLIEQKFETNISFLRVKGHGNGELGISLAGFREGKAKLIKDNKNLPSILTIISDIMEDVLEPKPKSDKNRKDPKKGKSIRFDTNYQFLRDTEEGSKIERSLKDDRIIAALLEKLRTNDSNTRNDYGQYFSIQDAYNAFELLFGTRLTSEIESRLKSFSEDQFRSFINRNIAEENQIDDELNIVPLEAQEKILEEKLKIVPPLTSQTYYKLDDELEKANGIKKQLENGQSLKNLWTQEKSKNGFKDGSFTRKKKHRTELSIQLPRLNDLVLSRKITSSIVNMGRGLKDKMMQMMPGIGMIISFLLQMALAHARTAASVAGIMSNMALGMGMFSMVRDTLFGQPNNPKVKYVYDTESADPGVSWPKEPSYWE